MSKDLWRESLDTNLEYYRKNKFRQSEIANVVFILEEYKEKFEGLIKGKLTPKELKLQNELRRLLKKRDKKRKGK